MNVYYVQFIVEPQRDNHGFGIFKSAIADMWICSKDFETAVKKAHEYLEKYYWSVLKMEPNGYDCTLEQLVESGKSLLPEVIECMLRGVGCHLTACTED